MTRVEARITVRMLGVLVIGLTVAPACSSVLALPWVIQFAKRIAADGGGDVDWMWILGSVARAVFYLGCMAMGVILLRRATRASAVIFPEARR